MSESRYGKLTWDRFKSMYGVIKRPGKYKVKVLRVSDRLPSRSITNPEGESQIANFPIVFGFNYDEVKQLFLDQGGEIEYSDLNGLTATFTIEHNPDSEVPKAVPGKGEQVEIIVGKYTPKTDAARNKGKEILVIEDMIVAPSVAVKSVEEDTGVSEFEDLEFEAELETESEEAGTVAGIDDTF